jgi:hypothetical protein
MMLPLPHSIAAVPSEKRDDAAALQENSQLPH